jgi:hypothetical protein
MSVMMMILIGLMVLVMIMIVVIITISHDGHEWMVHARREASVLAVQACSGLLPAVTLHHRDRRGQRGYDEGGDDDGDDPALGRDSRLVVKPVY